MILENKCKIYPEFKCINKGKREKCEFEKFLGDFIFYLSKEENIDYEFAGCPDAVFDDKDIDLIVASENKSEILLIEAKTLQLSYVSELIKAYDDFTNEIGKYVKINSNKVAKMYLEENGIEIELNETLLKTKKVINNDFNKLLDKVLEIMHLRNSEIKECIHLYYDGKEFNESSTQSKKIKYSNKNKREHFKLINNDFKNMLETRRNCTKLLLKKTNYNLIDENNLKVLESMSNDNMDVIINAKVLPNMKGEIVIKRNIFAMQELKNLIDDMINKNLESTYKKFEKFNNYDERLRKILFFNIDVESDVCLFHMNDILEYIQNFIVKYNNIDEVWMEYYEYNSILECNYYCWLENPVKQYINIYRRDNLKIT